ncbi:MAG: proline--tRNA ligase [Abditibacteriota bacterium]|nr:proline--tRNA ligase [Abditibacteriota bacterium]
MRASNMFSPTLREIPAEAEIISHKLLLRAGFIRKVSAGIYDYLPLGYKVLCKIQRILREELARQGAQEILMPALVSGDLYKETGRWDLDVLFKLKDRKNADYAIGFTHEEVVTDIVRRDVRSYRQLPLNLYQIQTKGRDEARPRAGLVRGREFIMMDAYSFDSSWEGLDRSYHKMFIAFGRTFRRCGIAPQVVDADSGAIGGKENQEYMVICDSGEDTILVCPQCGYSANAEKCEIAHSDRPSSEEPAPMERVATPGAKTIDQVASFLKISPKKLVKTLIYEHEGKVYAFLLRGDRDLNESKAARAVGTKSLEMAEPDTVMRVTGADTGFAGPVGLGKVDRLIADNEIRNMVNYAVGGCETDVHIINVNTGRDFPEPEYADLRIAVKGDPCPRCHGKLQTEKGMEVGHIFKLGTLYSDKMNAGFLAEDGAEKPFIMGCYGMGVSRLMSAIIEVSNDKDGMILPVSVAPFEVSVILVNPADETQCAMATRLYEELSMAGADVLLDDRDERPGVKFKDNDLWGIPIQVVVGKGAAEGKAELSLRRDKQRKESVPIGEASAAVLDLRGRLYEELSLRAGEVR